MLDLLDRQNLFLVPLDDHRRYPFHHHLFADVLRVHLAAGTTRGRPELHRRACRWFNATQDPGTRDAVRHALAAGDVDDAARLVELALRPSCADRRETWSAGGSTTSRSTSSATVPSSRSASSAR